MVGIHEKAFALGFIAVHRNGKLELYKPFSNAEKVGTIIIKDGCVCVDDRPFSDIMDAIRHFKVRR